MLCEMSKNKASNHHFHRDDVEEATLALKGMLGISLITPSPTKTPPSKNTYASALTSTKQPKPQQQPQSSNSKGKKKKNHKNHKHNNNNNSYNKNHSNNNSPNSSSNSSEKKKQHPNKHDKNKSENYAWSAFQSPPDASALPMPAFGASSSSITGDALFSKEPEEKEEDDPISLNQVQAEEILSRSSSAAVSNADDIKALLNIRTNKKPTGVNLAAAANATPVQNRQLRHPPNDSTPLYHPAASPPPPRQPMPPYVTIQVQVPPVLLPGRQMMVPPSNLTGPYPIPVIVPEGVQPGMIIPVHVPTMYHPPPHMLHPNIYNNNTNTTNNPHQPLFPPTTPNSNKHNPNNPNNL